MIDYNDRDRVTRFVPDADYLEDCISKLLNDCLPDSEVRCGRIAVTPNSIRIQLAGYTWEDLA